MKYRKVLKRQIGGYNETDIVLWRFEYIGLVKNAAYGNLGVEEMLQE